MINLIIQRTFNGLKTDFQSQELHLSNNDIENIFGDEQNAAQLSNSSVIYTVENQAEYRVYSYINPAVSDNAGRAGYYAIRLLIPKDKILVNLNAIFNKIAQHYGHYFEQQDLANQNYSELLAAVIKQNCLLDRSVITGSKKDGVFYLKYAADERVDDPLNDEPTYLIKKLYLFAKDQSKSDDIIRQFGFKSFAALLDTIKNIKVINPDNHLQVLKINENEISFPQGNFEVFVFDSDHITYRDKNRDSKKDIEHRGKTLEIRRPIPVHVPPVYPPDSTRKRKGFGLGLLLAISLGTLIVGGALGWGGKQYFASKTIADKDSEIEFLEKKKPLYFKVEPISGGFILDGKSVEDLKNYKFRYTSSSQTWDFDEGYGSFKKLDSKTMEEIALNKNFNEDELIEALEKISGKKIDLSKENNSSQNTISAETTSIPDISSGKPTVEKPKEQTPVSTPPKSEPKPAVKQEVQKASPAKAKQPAVKKQNPPKDEGPKVSV